MKKSCSARKVGHTRSRVNFNELLQNQKKVDRASSAGTCSGCLALTELTRLGEPKEGR